MDQTVQDAVREEECKVETAFERKSRAAGMFQERVIYDILDSHRSLNAIQHKHDEIASTLFQFPSSASLPQSQVSVPA